MYIAKVTQEIALATVSVTIALFQIGVLTPGSFSPSAAVIAEADLQPPASSDSNRKKDLNVPYVVTLEEIRAFYVQAEAGALQGITIDEGVLHGTLTYNGREVQAGDYFTVTQLAQGLVYTPEAGFQGADHFKFQTEDLYNLGNISSFNFDIIGGTVFHRRGEGGHVETPHVENDESSETDTGFGGSEPEAGAGDGVEFPGGYGGPGSRGGGEIEGELEPLPGFDGTGAGGFPEDVEAELVRTGGWNASETNFNSFAVALVCLVVGFGLRVQRD